MEIESLRYARELEQALITWRPQAYPVAVSILESRPRRVAWGKWMALSLSEVRPLELRALVRIELRRLAGDIPELRL